MIILSFWQEENHSRKFKAICECAFTIVPSEWYDNFPNTILESFAFRKCVVATNIGSLKRWF